MMLMVRGISLKTFLIFITCLSLFGIESCRNCKPIKVSLSEDSKTWISYAGTQFFFRNQDSGLVIFNYSHPADEFVTSYFRGEECGDADDIETISFNLTSSTLPYSFDFSLVADAEGSPADAFYSVKSGNPELALVLYIFGDTATFSFSGDTVHGESIFDQLDLNGISFYNVYHSALDSLTTSTVTDIYFTKPDGVVGFKTKDGDTWSIL
jgi:hypothetical protein